jgi:uncharacterized protein (TIGR03067 family)
MKSKRDKLFLLLFMFIVLLVACGTPAELEGTWSGYEIGGPHRDWTLTIERNQFALVCENTSMWYKGSLKLNNNCNRNKMDLIISDTPVRSYNEKTSFGIYKIEDGSLILVTAEPGNMQRPFSFDETEEVIAFVFEKSKED